MDYTVHGILQARILEWVAIPFSRGFPDPWIEPESPALQVDSLPSDPTREAQIDKNVIFLKYFYVNFNIIFLNQFLN